MSQSLVRPNWGHALLAPDGIEIRLPQFAFPKLRRLGLLERNRNVGLYQISDAIYAFMGFEYDSLMDGLRQLLGVDIRGPEWLQCGCRQCHRRDEDADKTPISKEFQRKPNRR